MHPRSAVVVLLALALSAGAGACGVGDGARGVHALLEVVPAEAAARGLFYTRLEPGGEGFGSVLPLRGAGDLLGVAQEDLTDLLETGGAPLTVLAGQIRADEVAGAVSANGYATATQGEWTVFTGGATGPLAAAVPAGAVTDGLLVLGDEDEVRAAVAGDAAVTRLAGVDALAEALADASAAAMLVEVASIVEAAAGQGGVAEALERGGAQGDLPPWDAAALAWLPDADDGDGAVLLAYDGPVDGHETARVLVLRAATTPLLGPARRTTSELFERGPPRWFEDEGVVRLPVTWREADHARVRRDVESGALLFLAPAEP